MIICLEFDRRFVHFGDSFVFYDYNEPVALPAELKRSFDLVIADPPFLSEECLRKTAQTVHYLTTKKILLCTGMWELEFINKIIFVCSPFGRMITVYVTVVDVSQPFVM